jgi:predicted nucleic acid-binding protein
MKKSVRITPFSGYEIRPVDEEARDSADICIRSERRLPVSDSLSIRMMEKNEISAIFSFDPDVDCAGTIMMIR